jgi:hypothetical protein
MLDRLVEIDEGSDCAWFNDGSIDRRASERPDRIHGLPTCEHQELDLVANSALAQMRAKESRKLSELRDHGVSKMSRICVGARLGRASPPFSNDHAALREYVPA